MTATTRRRRQRRLNQTRSQSNNDTAKVSTAFKILAGITGSLFAIFMLFTFSVASAFNRDMLRVYIVILSPAALVFVILSIIIVIRLTKVSKSLLCINQYK
ncbi:hypothetical protein FBUS_01621 [Fasciolopsis buskii]|uniref:Uncharacterized protein n=1 Tax=Fasciolopsis buskii TaxID=27845 RepID=A0A8E0VPH1_9TREM|nr:hypothetical protein FBUS_01621 [Fasciolopsis buski]